MKGWQAARFEELDSIPLFEGLVWHPVRKHFGIQAFGVNAYTTGGAGEQVVEEHDERGGGAGGHEELYVVLTGRATFTLGGESQDAPAGTLHLHRRPVGAPQGDRRGGRDRRARDRRPGREGLRGLGVGVVLLGDAGVQGRERWDEAIAIMEDGLAAKPGHPAILYNLACAESRGGRPLDALTHLQQAVRGDAKWLERAKTDPDFDPIRREPGFPA